MRKKIARKLRHWAAGFFVGVGICFMGIGMIIWEGNETRP